MSGWRQLKVQARLLAVTWLLRLAARICPEDTAEGERFLLWLHTYCAGETDAERRAGRMLG